MPRKRDMELRAKKRPGARKGFRTPDGRRPSEQRHGYTLEEKAEVDKLVENESMAERIAAECKLIQETWTDEERFRRAGVKPLPLDITEIEMGPIRHAIENNNY